MEQKSPLVPVFAFGLGFFALYKVGSMVAAREEGETARYEVARQARKEARRARRRKWRYGLDGASRRSV